MNNRRSLGKNGLVDGVGRSGAAVHDTAPTASFTATPSTGVAVGDTVNLDASGSSDPEGDALTYAWTITDPSSNTTSLSGETPSFTIDESGTWTIDLTVTDTDGLTDDASQSFAVNTAPTASFTYSPSTDIAVDDTVNLDASGSTDPEGDTLTYDWTVTLPDGTTSVLTGETTSITITQSGDWTVDLTVTDPGGLSDSTSQSFAVSPYQLVADTSPALFVPLNYASTSADGQILYQDSAATTPVDASGEPVGGVEFGGTKRAEQINDSKRPIFQGDGNGTLGVPANRTALLVSGNVANTSLLFAFQLDIQNFDVNGYHWGASYADGLVGTFTAFNQSLVFSWRTANGSYIDANANTTLGRHVVISELTAGDVINLYIDDPSAPAASTTAVDGDSVTPTSTQIFSRSGKFGNDILGAWAAYEGAKTTTERTAIYDALAKGWMP